MAFSPDVTILATASNDTMVRLWSVAGRAQIGASLGGHTDAVLCLAFSPDGRRLATGSADRTVTVWDVANPAAPTRARTLSP